MKVVQICDRLGINFLVFQTFFSISRVIDISIKESSSPFFSSLEKFLSKFFCYGENYSVPNGVCVCVCVCVCVIWNNGIFLQRKKHYRRKTRLLSSTLFFFLKHTSNSFLSQNNLAKERDIQKVELIF